MAAERADNREQTGERDRMMYIEKISTTMSKNPAGAAQQSPTGTNNTQPAPKRQDQKSTPEIPKPSATYAQVLALGKPAIPMPLNPIPPKPGVPAPLIPSRAAEQHHGANEKNKKNPSRKHKQPSLVPPRR